MIKRPDSQFNALSVTPEDKEKPEDSTTMLLTQMLVLQEQLIQQKGKEAADALMKMIMGGEHSGRILQTGEKMANLEEAKEEALKNLEEAGYLWHSPEGLLVVDVDKMKAGVSTEMFGQLYRATYLGGRKNGKALWLLFAGKKGISKEDYEAGDREVKDIFYFPANSDDALNLEKIRKADFYLNPSEVLKTVEYSRTKFGDIKDLDYREVLIPLLIYHPKYENGFRDPDTGELMVAPKGQSPRKLTVKYFVRKYGQLRDKASNSQGMDRAREFIANSLSHLWKDGKDLLRPDDFEMASTSTTAETQRVEKATQQRGMVMLNRVKHTLGSEYGPESGNFKVVMITPETGGVVTEKTDGKTELLATFNILKPEIAGKTDKGYYVAGVKETDARKYKAEKLFPRGSEEGERDYQDRLDSQASFGELLAVSKYLSKEVGINLVNFSFKEQTLIATAAQKLDYQNNKKFLRFVREYKEDGLKVLSAIEFDQKLLDNILYISENFDNKIAWSIFRKYNEIADLKNNIEEELSALSSEKIGAKQEVVDSVSYDITKKANAFLLDFSQKEKGKSGFSRQKLTDGLDNYRKELVLSASIYKNLRGKEVNFKDLIGITFEQTSARELTAETGALEAVRANYQVMLNSEGFPMIPGSSLKGMARKFSAQKERSYNQLMEMFRMYENSYKDNPVLQKKLIAGYIKTLETQGEKSKIYVFKQDGKTITFCRFDDLGQGKKYFGSFNVASEGTGMAIGTAMMETALEQEAQSAKEIEADCEPYKGISQTYIDSRGFAVRNVIPNYADAGITVFNIIRSRATEKMYYKDYRKEDIIKEYEKDFSGNKYTGTEAQLVLKFPANSIELYQTAENLVNNQGYLITRYFFTSDKKEVYCAFERVS